MVIFENVSKVYDDGTVAVDNLNLEVGEGELVVFIGPSGCGKTTSLKMTNRLEDPSSGRILVNGNDITRMNKVKLRRNIGYVIQEIGLFPHMTVAENIGIVPRLFKWQQKKTDKRVDELLEMAGLVPPLKYKYRLPEQLSGGQQQRIGVLRALAVEPQVILMDEPFGALDPISRDNLQNELMDLQRRLKKTIIFVTHDIDEALKIADKIVIMRRGKVVQTGTPAEIQGQPVNEFVKDFIGQDRLSAIDADSPVKMIMEEAPLVFKMDHKPGRILDELEDMGYDSAQVLDRNGYWVGMVTISQVKRASRQKLSLKQVLKADRKLPVEDATLRDAAGMLDDIDLPIPVLDKDKKLLGLVTHNGIAKLTVRRLQRQTPYRKKGEAK
ncbi:MAG: betaine/proline/choline family ABC transporter ATP-binding protein [Firmicutes bacterium]|nr:betaine/proline/choline family ABC transporter ATP-binding protein [Bacillota bacterium]